jgi:hypothetical protein
MKKLAALMIVFAVCLWAADFWQTKPFTEWSDKDAAKMTSNSPWAKEFSVEMTGMAAGGGGGGKKGGGTRDGGQTGADAGGAPSVTLTIRWVSALPVKQALVRLNFKGDAANSDQVKKSLDMVEPDYVIVVSGLNRGMVRGDADELKQAMIAATELAIKGKEPIKAKDFRIVGQGRVDAVFAFPKTSPITEDDKEVEFQSKVGTISIRERFRLKDMMFNGNCRETPRKGDFPDPDGWSWKMV